MCYVANNFLQELLTNKIDLQSGKYFMDSE